MPSGGHNRKPRQQKVIQGTFQQYREPKHEPAPPVVAEVPKAPSHLNRWAKTKWKELSQQLIDDGILTVLDLTTLEVLCANYGIYRELHDEVYRREPTGDVAADGKPKTRRRTLAEYMAGRNSQTMPEYTALTKALTMYRALMGEFGLSPVSRGRINVPPPPKGKDPMQELLDE